MKKLGRLRDSTDRDYLSRLFKYWVQNVGITESLLVLNDKNDKEGHTLYQLLSSASFEIWLYFRSTKFFLRV